MPYTSPQSRVAVLVLLTIGFVSSLRAEEVIFKKVIQAGDTINRLNFDNELEEVTVDSFVLHNWAGNELAVTASDVAGIWDGNSFNVYIPTTWDFPGYQTFSAIPPTSPALNGSIDVIRLLSNGELGFVSAIDDRDTGSREASEIIGVTNAGGFLQLRKENGTSEEQAAFSSVIDFSADGSAALGTFNFQVPVGETVEDKVALGWRFLDGSDLKVWRRGEDAPGVEGKKQTDFFVPLVILDDRTILAHTQVSDDGLFTNAEGAYYLIGPDGSPEFLFRSTGEPYEAVEGIIAAGTMTIPNLPGPGIDNFDMNPDKHIAFGTLLNPDEGSSVGAILTKAPGELPMLVVTQGTPVLNAEGETIGTFESVNHTSVFIDDLRNITFEAELSGAGENTVWRYLAENQRFIRVGPVIGAPVPGIENSTVRRARMIAMNAAGRLALQVDGFGDAVLALQSDEGVLVPLVINGELADGSESGVFWTVSYNEVFQLSDAHVLAMNVSTNSGNTIYTARLASDVVAVGDDYIWDGGAGTDDWHTVTNGRSNWVDSQGAPWPAPPGISGNSNEEVSIGSGFVVKLNNPASVDNVRLTQAELEVNSDLAFQFLVDVPSGSTLSLNSGSLKSTLGLVEVGGTLSKGSSGSFVTEVVEIGLSDATFSMENGSLLFDNGETQFENTILLQAGGELTLTDEVTRFQGEAAEVKILGGTFDLKSKTISLETDTLLETATNSVSKLGGDQADAKIAFDGGTSENKRTFEFKGNGDVEVRVAFAISESDELLINNSKLESNQGVVFNLPTGKTITAFGNLINNGRMTLQRGGLLDQVHNNGRFIIKAETPQESLILSCINNDWIEQFSDIQYALEFHSAEDSTYHMHGGALMPQTPESDLLIFEKGTRFSVKNGTNEIQFPESESSRLSTSINIEGSASLEISGIRMTEEVKITVESESGSVTLENTEFEKLFIEGEGDATLRGKLHGKLPGGLPTRSPHAQAFLLPPVFELSTKTYRMSSVELIGSGEGEQSTLFVLGDSKPGSGVPYHAHSGSLSGVKIGSRATLVNSESSILTVESALSIEHNLINYGGIILEADILVVPSENDSAGFGMARFFNFPKINHLTIPPNLEDEVVIEPNFFANFGGVSVGEGSVLILRRFSSTIDENQQLSSGTWEIFDRASVLFRGENQVIEDLEPILSISERAKLIVHGTDRGILPPINGFRERNEDLDILGSLTLIDARLEFISGKGVLNLGELTLTRSRIIGSVENSFGFNENVGSFRAKFNLGNESLVVGQVINDGDLSTGSSPGTGTVEGDLTLSETSRIHVEFAGEEAGSEFDQLEVAGTATLDGELVLYFLDGYEPTGGEQFEFLKAPTITGNFAEIDQSRLGRDIRMDFAVGDTGLMATAMPLTIASYGDWRAAFFTEPDAADDLVSGPGEDPDGDGWTNRMEYLFDGNPNVQDGSPVTFTLTKTGTPEVYSVQAVFDWVASVTDVVWAFETSDDLQSWTEVAATESSQTPNGDYVTSVVDFDETVDASNRIFLRMSAKDVVP